jgi:hypothetical protein
VLQQQLRVGGLALATAAATAGLALVTFLVSNLVLAVVAGLGVGEVTAEAATDDRAVQGVLLSAEPAETDQTDERDPLVCAREPAPTAQGKDRPVRCHERRVDRGGPPVD